MADSENIGEKAEETPDALAAPMNRAERRAAARGKKLGQGQAAGNKDNPGLPGHGGWTGGAGSKTHFHRKSGGK